MTDLAQRIASLPPEKRALLERQLLERRGQSTAESRIRPRGAGDHSPLSYAQERLWFLHEFDPTSPVYNISVAFQFLGHLDVEALHRSLDEIVRRHEGLRTTFDGANGTPVQRVAASLELAIPRIDLCDLPDAAREAEAERLVAEAARQPFELIRGPLLRTLLLRLSDEEHRLLLTIHHIVSDGWSMGVLYRELGLLYEAFTHGRTSPLVELPAQYADYACWQREWLQGEVLKSQREYWLRQLAGAPDLLELPTDHPRPAARRDRGARRRFSLSSALTEALRAVCRREGVTLFMLLLAAFQTLLHRYTNSEDVLVGSPIANRNRTEIEGLIGFFVNTLVLRTDLSGDPPFRQLLQRVREVTLAGYAHPDLPFEKLVEVLQPERNPSHTPLFQVMFVLQNAPAHPLALPGLRVSRLEMPGRTAKFDLTLSITEGAADLTGSLEYSTDLFEESTIGRMLGHFQVLLEGIVADPDQPLSRLPLLTPSERRHLLEARNDTQAEFPHDQCLHHLVEQQVERTPDAVAVVSDAGSLTYAELNRQANQLAHTLIQQGVGPEVPVALCVERSPGMLVALLAILKAGGAYVPLDPSYPTARLAGMLADALPRVMITDERSLSVLPVSAAPDALVVCLDRDDAVLAGASDENPAPRAGPEQLAYVIYTSGSTGQPKGVMISHRALVNLLWSMRAQPGLTAEDTLVAVTTLSFDIAGLELWLPLLVGARVVIVNREVARDGLALARTLEAVGATVLQATPATWQLLLSAGWLSTATFKMLCGGEALSRDLADRLLSGGGELWNLYGPTETTIYSCGSKVTTGSGPVVLGPPIANTQLYLLDRHLQPVPLGVPGELYIGGVGLARGYLNQPELTAERFIPHPFSPEPGARLYKTGDLARPLPDGNLEFLGRLDHQVKLRGFRIELGEIEAMLHQHPAVRQAVVVAREDSPGEKRLVGYMVPNRNTPTPELLNSELRRLLQQKLPDYMLPAAFMWLAALPLTPSGKVDRRALPAPEPAQLPSPAGSVAPRSPVEEALAEIWTEVLGLDRLGIHDDFFELGGHSLLATQVISRVRLLFQTEIPLRRMFEAPTIAGLAECVEAALRGQDQPIPKLVKPVHREGDRPLSFAQQRLWFLDHFERQSATYNIPLALHLQGALDVAALEQSLREIVRRHEVLRTTFPAKNGSPTQAIAPDLDLVLPVEVVEKGEEGAPGGSEERALSASVREWIRAEAARPFDLTGGPLVRARLLRLAPEEHVLSLCLHHIIADGWSLGVLFHELAELYDAFRNGAGSQLPELPLQYADFALWQRDWLQGETLQRQLAYWKQQLTGAPDHLELPTDRPRPPVKGNAGARLRFSLPPTLTDALHVLCRQEGVTPFMLLLAAFQVLLHRYTGAEDLMVGTPIANRNHIEIEGLIGLFVNTLVLRTDLSSDPTFQELLQRAREVALDAYAHQDLPFEKLVEEIQPERDPSRTPLFQVLFAFQNTPAQPLTLPGLVLSRLEIPSRTAKFDLTLSLTERDGALAGSIEYSTELFDAETVRRMLGHFETLLDGIATDPGRRLSELPLMSEAEQRQLLVEWSGAQADPRSDSCVHELFEAQAALTPDAVAVSIGDRSLTYRELDHRANHLAHRLQRLGVGADVLVALLVERSLEMVVALLATLKAGGAYLPLAPDDPQERLAFLLDDAQAAVILTQLHLGERLPETSLPVLYLDGDDAPALLTSEERPTGSVNADHLAYVAYTSGSTGQPKGVCVPHRGVVRLVIGAGYARLTAEDTFLQLAPLAFDASTFEIWGCLLNGGRLILFPPQPPTLAEIEAVVQQHRVSILWLTAGLFHQMVEHRLQGLRGVRQLLAGGDVLSVPHVQRVLRELPGCQLINGYGPTEGTTFTCCYPIPPDWPGESPVPIGRPIAGTEVYILDQQRQPVPVGVPGELYIGGDGLARGYLNRPDLTAERFVAHPFSPDPSARLYRTGDRVRWRADGTLEFLGRLDEQVKIRGFRIEPGEIESCLAQHPGVREAVVVAREDRPGDKRLVAYLVPQGGAAPAVNELHRFLQEKLPHYMLPAAFVFLDSLPLSPNGKVDRRALPAPQASGAPEAVTSMLPRSSVQEALAEIWAEVLGVESVGIRDNFFELGGHSLLAVQLFAQIEKLTGKDLPMATLFQAPTVEQLAAILSQEGWAPPWRSLVAIQPHGSRPPFFCMHAGGGNVLFYRDLALRLGDDQPFYGLQAVGSEGKQPASRSVEGLAAFYLKEIQSLQPEGPYFLGGASFGGLLAWEMAQQLHAQGQEVALLAIFDTHGLGYPKLRPDTTRFHRRLYALARRVEHHVGSLWLLEWRGKWPYIVQKTRQALHTFGRSVRKRRRAFVRGYYQALRSPLPPALQQTQSAILRAQREYVPQVYAGRVTLFRASKQPLGIYPDPTLGWEKLAAGGLEIHEVPGHHGAIVAEPRVRFLVEVLKDCLRRAQRGDDSHRDDSQRPITAAHEPEQRSGEECANP